MLLGGFPSIKVLNFKTDIVLLTEIPHKVFIPVGFLSSQMEIAV
jgi:hypothetical protein